MEELAIKLAETLDISVQAAIDMYPIIRSQYVWYEILSTIMIWSIILGIVSILGIGITAMILDETKKFDYTTEEITKEWASIHKLLKKAILALVIFVVIGIVSSIVIPIVVPDIMIIKNFLG